MHNEYSTGKAIKTLNVLLNNCKSVQVKPKLLCQLFDAFVGSILNYGSEVWGFTKSKSIERVHLKFCKRILNVRNNSSSAAVYGELERCPLYVSRYVRIIKYWCKLVHSKNNLLKKVMKYLLLILIMEKETGSSIVEN